MLSTKIRQNQQMPARALRQLLLDPDKWIFHDSQNQQMPARALRPSSSISLFACFELGQNQQMPARALRQIHIAPAERARRRSESTNARKGIKTDSDQLSERSISMICQNQQMPARALRPSLRPPGQIRGHARSESTNARKGIKTCSPKKGRNRADQVRINKCPQGH